MSIRSVRRGAAILLAAVLGTAWMAPAAAITVYVRAAPINVAMPDGSTVPMWGYRVGPTRASVTNLANVPSSPGAAITVPAGDSTLRVVLINNLPVPTSFVLHGHNTTMTPVFTDAGGNVCTPATGTPATLAELQDARGCRVRSFTHEAPPRDVSANGNTALDVVYEYANVKPGTYLYQSGTHPQIQVQMGLYGIVRKNAPPPVSLPGRNAYADLTYDGEIALVLSEVDPAVHAAVAAGTFSGSTLAYDPKYFRLHRYAKPAATCDAGTSVAACIAQPIDFTERTIPTARAALTVQPGTRQLLRVANAGLQSRSLMLIDGHWYVIAEDGNPIRYPREQYSAFLPAAKTADLWFTPTLAADETSALDRQLTIFDRRLALTNNNADPSGGQLLRLNVANVGAAPTVDVSACAASATQGSPYACAVAAAGSGTLDYALDVAPVGMSIDGGGTIAWTPNNDQAWKPLLGYTTTNPVQVRVTDRSTGRYSIAGFNVTVANVDDAPVALDDAYDVHGGTLNATRPVLANDSDPDGDPLGSISVTSPPSNGSVVMNPDGTFTYTASTLPVSGSQTTSFTYTVTANGLPSNSATVTLTLYANSAPVAVDDVDARAFAATGPSYLDVLANDYDVDGNLDVGSLVIVGGPNRGGSASVVTAGCPVSGRPCISYLPPVNFRGTEAITYRVSDSLGAASSAATARVNVQ